MYLRVSAEVIYFYLSVSKVRGGDDSGQSIVVLPPQFQGRLHVPISSREFLLELEHNVGEVLVHDGGVGGSLVSGQPQLDLPDFEHVAGQVLSARPLLPTGKIQE